VLFKIGGICTIICGLVYLISAGLSIVIGPPPNSSELYLQSLAGHPFVSIVNFSLWVLSDVLLLFGLISFYLILKSHARNAMLVATVLMILFCVLDLALTELNSITLVILSKQYMSAATDIQKTYYLSAATYALGTLPVATFLSYVISSAGLSILSIVMLKGIFGKPTAILGIVASIEGLIDIFFSFPC
jgi:hypothetical protein